MTSIRGSLKRAYYSAVSAVHRRPLALNDTAPMVTFTFDDFPRSAYEAAGATLRAFGGHGTYYAAAGWMDGGPATGDRFRTADLPRLLRDGHELGTHTYSHVSLWSTLYSITAVGNSAASEGWRVPASFIVLTKKPAAAWSQPRTMPLIFIFPPNLPGVRLEKLI
jgi:hypothetical protein